MSTFLLLLLFVVSVSDFSSQLPICYRIRSPGNPYSCGLNMLFLVEVFLCQLDLIIRENPIGRNQLYVYLLLGYSLLNSIV